MYRSSAATSWESQREPVRARVSQTTLFCCKTVKYNSVSSQNFKIRYFLSWNVKIRYFLSRNIKIRAMSRKNGINCAASWLRIFCCSGQGKCKNTPTHVCMLRRPLSHQPIPSLGYHNFKSGKPPWQVTRCTQCHLRSDLCLLSGMTQVFVAGCVNYLI